MDPADRKSDWLIKGEQVAKGQTHEAGGHSDEVKMGSERGFGLVFAAVFAIIGLWPLWSGGTVRWWSLAVAAGFLVAAFVRPAILRPLNRLWFRFGMVLSKIMTPVIMGVLFITTFVPMGVAMRWIGKKDLLRLKLEPDAASYWIRRDPPGPEPESMKNQF